MKRRQLFISIATATALFAGTAVASAAVSGVGVLAVSKSANRSAALSLDGAKLSGNAYIFINKDNASQVSFSLDGKPYSTELVKPFDLATTAADGTAKPLDTTKLTKGSHKVTAVVKTTTNRSRSYSATFTVDNTVAVPTTTTTTTTAKPTTTTTTKPTTTTSTTVKPTTTTIAPSNNKNCANAPSACGYPDATNTGARGTLKRVPEDITSGSGWHWDSRGWITVDGDGGVVENISTTSNIDVISNNVTVNNVVVHAPSGWFGVSARHAAGLTVKNSTISGGSTGADRMDVAVKDIYGDISDMKVIGNNIYYVSTGVQIGAGLIQDNYIHDMGYKDGDHLNGTTSNGSSVPLTIQHNTVFNQFGQTDAISLFQDFGLEANRLVTNNLVAGGGYTVYGGSGTKGTSHDIKITNNRFSRLYFPNGGGYGPLAAFDSNGTNNSFSGNYWDDTLAPVNY